MANIELDGANKKIKVDSGDLTLDVPGDIILDADGGDIVVADGGTNILKVTNSSSDVVLQPQVDAKDIKFNQYDGRTLLEVNDGGFVAIANGATGSGQLRIYEDTDNGTNFTAFQVGTQSGDITYTLPTADGSNGQALTTNGSGTLSFSTVSADADNYFATSGLSSKDLGTGLHIKTADSGASVDGSADELVIEGSGNSGLSILSGTSSIGGMVFGDSGSSGKGQVNYNHNGDYMYFVADGAEKMRIESGGTVEIKSGTSGLVQFIKFENAAGDTTYGIVGAEGANNAVIGSGDTGLKIDAANDIIRPYTITGSGGRDDAIDLGSSSHRFDDVFATNGTIQTSDKNQKNTITATDLGLAFVDKLTPVSYKFNNKTRTHYGLIAQDVETVLGDISKSTADFAGFIKTDVSKDNKDDLDKVTKLINDNVDPSTGEAYTSEKLKELQDRKTEIENKNDTVYGLRYQEFISPIIKAIQELSARVTTLEG
jgi:hypothetical protein